jgi:hypothetical protein
MNKHNSNPLATTPRHSSFFFSVCASLLLLAPVFAQATEPTEDTPRVSVQYTKPINGQPVFVVTLNNEQAEAYELRITDDAGTVLYTEQIRSKQYSKRFQLAAGVSDDVKLYVEVVPRSNRKLQGGYRVEGAAGGAKDLVVSRY